MKKGKVFYLIVATLLASCTLLMVMPASAVDYPITITDSAGREVTVEIEPIRIIVLNTDATEAVKVLGEVYNIVGVVEGIKTKKDYYFPELQDTESVGTWKEYDYEKIAELAKNESTEETDPTLVITYVYKLEPVEKLEEFENITVVAFDFYKHDTLYDEITKLGMILNATEAAEEYNSWCQEKEAAVINSVAGLEQVSREELANAIVLYLEAAYLGERVEHLELDNLRRLAWFHSYGLTPGVFIEGKETGLGDIGTKGPGSADDLTCIMAGGKNIAGDLDKLYPHVNWEWVMEQNPNVIIKGVYTDDWGWSSINEPEGIIDEINDRTGAGGILAVKGDKIYAFCNEPLYGMDSVIGLTYWAKLIHPELDLDPEAVYTEYLTNFMGGISYGDAIFVYPEV